VLQVITTHALTRVRLTMPKGRHSRHAAHLLVVVSHLGPGLGNLAQDIGVRKARVLLAELLANSVLEFEVS
jgi:hypothetical protein